ncbi:MAG: hypothetical protein R6X17_07345 [Candidatus Competibacteraceae bacterium]
MIETGSASVAADFNPCSSYQAGGDMSFSPSPSRMRVLVAEQADGRPPGLPTLQQIAQRQNRGDQALMGFSSISIRHGL